MGGGANCKLSEVVVLRFSQILLTFLAITNNYFSGFNFTNSKFSKGLYNSKEYVDSALRAPRMNEALMFMGSQFAESRAAARYIDIIDTIDTINPYIPIPKLSDLNMYIDLFDSSIYSFPVTKDLHITIINAAKEQIEQRLSIEDEVSPQKRQRKTQQAVPVTGSPGQQPGRPTDRPSPRKLGEDDYEDTQ